MHNGPRLTAIRLLGCLGSYFDSPGGEPSQLKDMLACVAGLLWF